METKATCPDTMSLKERCGASLPQNSGIIDPYIVNFDEKADPDDPRNWRAWKKWTIVLLGSTLALIV